MAGEGGSVVKLWWRVEGKTGGGRIEQVKRAFAPGTREIGTREIGTREISAELCCRGERKESKRLQERDKITGGGKEEVLWKGEGGEREREGVGRLASEVDGVRVCVRIRTDEGWIWCGGELKMQK